jgi:hypothetical protein
MVAICDGDKCDDHGSTLFFCSMIATTITVYNETTSGIYCFETDIEILVYKNIPILCLLP